MPTPQKLKRLRAIAITLGLVVAANFAVSRAESTPAQPNKNGTPIEMKYPGSHSIAADPSTPFPPPRPSSTFTADPSTPFPPPRPSSFFAADPSTPFPPPRPSSNLASTDQQL